MIRAVFFDVGGTLIHPWPSVGTVYARVGRQFGLTLTEDEMEQAFRAAWKETKATGRLTTSDKNWWRTLVERALAMHRVDCPVGYFEALYDAFVEADAWRVAPEVLPVLQSLRERGMHVGVISNWDERLRPLLKNLGLLACFESLTISCEVGVEKPDARIFQAALRAAHIPAQESLHIGDSEIEDVQAAQAVGMTACLVKSGESLQRVLTLCDVSAPHTS